MHREMDNYVTLTMERSFRILIIRMSGVHILASFVNIVPGCCFSTKYGALYFTELALTVSAHQIPYYVDVHIQMWTSASVWLITICGIKTI